MGEERICWLCNWPAFYNDPLDKHHIFGGTGRRAKSERDGLYVYLHHFKCHESGPLAAHQNAATMQRLHEFGERKWLSDHPGATVNDFIREYGRNYL